MATALRVKEQNGVQNACCPNCSKMYRLFDEKGQENELPTKCKRCGSPMDFEKAKAFSEAQALKEHQPGLTILGDRMRARSQGEPIDPEPAATGRRRG